MKVHTKTTKKITLSDNEFKKMIVEYVSKHHILPKDFDFYTSREMDAGTTLNIYWEEE